MKEETVVGADAVVYPTTSTYTLENTLEETASTPFYYHQTFVAAISDVESDPRCMSLLSKDEVGILSTFYSLTPPAQLFVHSISFKKKERANNTFLFCYV